MATCLCLGAAIAPVDTLVRLTRTILFTLRLVLKDAWLQMFELPAASFFDSALIPYYLVIAVVILAVVKPF